MGNPLAEGNITFKPDDPNGRAASGEIKDGLLSLTTASRRRRSLPGKYAVTIT